MLREARAQVLLPQLDALGDPSPGWRTSSRPADAGPTTVSPPRRPPSEGNGECGLPLKRQRAQLVAVPLLGKINGAVGTTTPIWPPIRTGLEDFAAAS